MDDEPRRPVWKNGRAPQNNARRLRLDLTDAERALWKELRAHRLDGASFRRQTPIGPYIADFVSHAAKLVIEIDGGQHFSEDGETRDARRTAYIESKGFRVVRFRNTDVLTNLPGALETILHFLKEKSPLPTSPASGRGDEIPAGDAE